MTSTGNVSMEADDMDEPSPYIGTSPRDQRETSDDDSESAVSATEVLRTMFDAILAEAERNPRFAQALLASLTTNAVVEVKPARSLKRSSATPFDPHGFSLVAVLRKEGPEKLRDRLDRLTKDQVAHMADAQTISLTPAELRKRKSAVISATIAATQARLADRFAAAD